VRLLHGPLRLRIEAEGPEAAEVAARAARDGLVLVGPGEEADLVARVAPSRGRAGIGERNRLSAREIEVLSALVEGKSNAEIAASLGIGLRTVRFHLEGLYSKLGVRRRGEAVREGIRMSLVRFRA
jgi:DNA-binding CsgD family transcriptional regulator